VKFDAAVNPAVPTSELRSSGDEKSVHLADVLDESSACRADTALPFACAEMAKHLDCKDIHHAPMDLIYERRNTFPRFLERREFDRNTRLMYLRSLMNLFREAQRCGWQPDRNLSRAWESLLPLAKSNGVAELLRHFAARRIEPSVLTRAQINDWIDQRVIKRERTFWSAWEMGSNFITMLLSKDFDNVDPVTFARRKYYRVKFTDLNENLQKEVNDLIGYLTSAPGNEGSDEQVGDSEDSWEDREDEIEDPNRKGRTQIRDVTAKGLRATICRMCGFIKETEDREISELRELYRKPVFWGYKKWLIEKRLIEPWALRSVFSGLVAAAFQYEKLASNRTWLRNFLAQIPTEPESDRRKRIADRSCLSYQKLRTIPDEIRKERINKQSLAESLPPE
jgi:hypothetical protein